MNDGVYLTIGVCCVWPVIFYLAMTYGLKFITSRDWRNIQWSEFKFPWSKHE